MGGRGVSFGEIVGALRFIFRDSGCPGNPVTDGHCLFSAVSPVAMASEVWLVMWDEAGKWCVCGGTGA